MPYKLTPRDSVCIKHDADGKEYALSLSDVDGAGVFMPDTFRVLICQRVLDPSRGKIKFPGMEILSGAGFKPDEPLIRVSTPDQRRGIISCDDIVSISYGCQLYFLKEENIWKMICCMGKYSDYERRR